MKKPITLFSQAFIGILFMFSGLVKMNDPVGFSFKLEEYFSEPVLNWPIFEPFALPIALFMVLAEVWLGAALLAGLWKKWVLSLLSAMIVFFAFLTFYSAYFNVVTDCGCFGDAIPLTPWQSFIKDIIFGVFILFLWWGKEHIYDRWPSAMVRIWGAAVPLATVVFSWYVLNHLPVKDFRPYAEGKSIVEGMKTAEELGLEPPQFEVVYTMYNSEGEQIEVTGTQYTEERWWEKKEWQMDNNLSKTIKVKEGYEPPVHDFSIYGEFGDITDSILDLPEVWLLIAYNVQRSNENGWPVVAKKAGALMSEGVPVLLLSASLPEDFQAFGLPPELTHAFTDETTLKTMVRSNPGWVVLKKGTVAKKFHFNDTPR